jgi:hypothetical protein
VTLHTFLRQQQDARRPPPGAAIEVGRAAAGPLTATAVEIALQAVARPDPPRLKEGVTKAQVTFFIKPEKLSSG